MGIAIGLKTPRINNCAPLPSNVFSSQLQCTDIKEKHRNAETSYPSTAPLTQPTMIFSPPRPRPHASDRGSHASPHQAAAFVQRIERGAIRELVRRSDHMLPAGTTSGRPLLYWRPPAGRPCACGLPAGMV